MSIIYQLDDMIVDTYLSKSFTTNCGEKMSAKLVYLLKTFMKALSAFKKAIWVFFKRYTL